MPTLLTKEELDLLASCKSAAKGNSILLNLIADYENGEDIFPIISDLMFGKTYWKSKEWGWIVATVNYMRLGRFEDASAYFKDHATH